MIKQQCAFPEPLMHWLQEKAALTGTPVSEIVRTIVREAREREDREKPIRSA